MIDYLAHYYVGDIVDKPKKYSPEIGQFIYNTGVLSGIKLYEKTKRDLYDSGLEIRDWNNYHPKNTFNQTK